jgi:hypothetical protein
MTSTTIRWTYLNSSSDFNQILLSGNIELKDLTLDANGTQGQQDRLVWARGVNFVKFTNVKMNGPLLTAMDTHGSSYVFLNGCDIVTALGWFGGNMWQTFVDDCNFYGASDCNALIYQWGGDGFAMTNSTAQDLDNSNPDSAAGWCQGRWVAGGGVWGVTRNKYLGDNTSYDMAVRPGCWNQNTGEQFMWEANLPIYWDTVASATSSSASFSVSPSRDLNDGAVYDAVIVSGKGIGQRRLITGWDASTKTITVSPDWNVVPDTTSRIDCGFFMDQCAIYGNTLDGKSQYLQNWTASAAIEPFGGCFDFIAASNTITDVRYGISSWTLANDGQPLWPTYFNLYVDNYIDNCIEGLQAVGYGYSSMGDLGTGYLGNVFRGNTVNNASYDSVNSWGGLAIALQEINPASSGYSWGYTVFEHNGGANMKGAIGVNQSGRWLDSTVNYKNSFDRGTAPLTGSVGVDFGSANRNPALRENTWSNFATTYSGTVPGAVLELPSRYITASGYSGSSSVTAALPVWNSGSSSLSWTASDDAAWLTLSATSGSVANENSSSNITLTCNPASLQPGTYTATVTVTSGSQTKKATVTFVVGAYSPPTSGMVLWLRADSMNLSDGALVNTWPDQSGAGNDATAYTWANWQPEFKTNIVNGKPVVRFGTYTYSQLKTANAVVANPPMTAFVVYKNRTAVFDKGIIDFGNVFFVDQGNGNARLQQWSLWTVYATVAIPTSAFGVQTVLINGASSSIWLNGTSQATPDMSAATLGASVWIGAKRNTSCVSNADIAEVIIYNTALSSTDRQGLEGYLMSKYGI